MMHARKITIRLHGPLAETYGAEHRLAVATPREAIFALDANYPGFRRDFIRYKHYALIADGDWLPPDAANGDPATIPVARQLDIVPLIEGRIVGLLAPLLGAIGITGTAATLLGGLLMTGLLIGVSMLLAPKAKKKEAEDSKKDESYAFSGPDNVTEQGVPVPLVYGRVHVGSVVISAGLEVADQFVPGSVGGVGPGQGGSFVGVVPPAYPGGSGQGTPSSFTEPPPPSARQPPPLNPQPRPGKPLPGRRRPPVNA